MKNPMDKNGQAIASSRNDNKGKHSTDISMDQGSPASSNETAMTAMTQGTFRNTRCIAYEKAC